MKIVLMTAALLTGAVALAHADQPGADWISTSDVAHQLSAAGYTDIRKIEADDGYWKAHAIKDGHLYKIDVDPYSGKVVWWKLKHRDHDFDDHD